MSFKIEYAPRDEAWLHSGEVAVPLEITVENGVAKIEYYPSARELVDEFTAHFGKDEGTLLCPDAVSWATKKFGSFLEKFGFEMSPDSEDYYINYLITEPQGTPRSEVVRLTGSEEYTDLTDTDIEGLISEGYVIYAAVVDSKIAALANTGEPITEHSPREVEIGVDTAKDYRRQGLGSACVYALARELCDNGLTAVYECASTNIASIRLAESLGGKVKSKKFYVVGFPGE